MGRLGWGDSKGFGVNWVSANGFPCTGVYDAGVVGGSDPEGDSAVLVMQSV
jgi:hypothetical protein